MKHPEFITFTLCARFIWISIGRVGKPLFRRMLNGGHDFAFTFLSLYVKRKLD